VNLLDFGKKGGDGKMKRVIGTALSLVLIGVFVSVLAGCGRDIKAENEKLKAENANLKAGNDKLKLDVKKVEEDAQKMATEKDTTIASKDATIASLNAENEALKKQVADLSVKVPKRKK
jgi:cell division protein FtsB